MRRVAATLLLVVLGSCGRDGLLRREGLDEASGLYAVELQPRGDAEVVVVWLHGLRGVPAQVEPLVPALGLESARFVIPRAPLRPLTVDGGAPRTTWYDILPRPPGQGREVAADARDSGQRLMRLLDREAARTPSTRIVVGGFSQGGAMALHVGTRYARPLLGIVVVSAYEVDPAGREAETPANARTPILFVHGTRDTVVLQKRGRAAYEPRAARATWHELDIGHEATPEVMARVGRWITARMAGQPE